MGKKQTSLLLKHRRGEPRFDCSETGECDDKEDIKYQELRNLLGTTVNPGGDCGNVKIDKEGSWA